MRGVTKIHSSRSEQRRACARSGKRLPQVTPWATIYARYEVKAKRLVRRRRVDLELHRDAQCDGPRVLRAAHRRRSYDGILEKDGELQVGATEPK